MAETWLQAALDCPQAAVTAAEETFERLGALVTGRPSHTAEVQGEISSTLEQLLVDHADALTRLVDQVRPRSALRARLTRPQRGHSGGSFPPGP